MTNIGLTMFIFTENSISAYNGTYLKPLDLEVGCISKKTFVKVLGQGIFLHTTGIYTTTGTAPRLVSAKIQQIFDNADINQLRQASAASDGTSYFVHIGTVNFYNKDGTLKKQLRNTVVEYNLQQNNFFIHTDIPISHFTSFVGESGKTLVIAKHASPSTSVNDRVFVSESVTVVRT